MTTPNSHDCEPHTSDSEDMPLPSNIWTPSAGASIEVYWDRHDDDSFDVALQLIDPALLDDDDRGIIVWSLLGPQRSHLPFSLYEESTRKLVLSGRFMWCRIGPSSQLWLLDAKYPGGHIRAAQIA